MHTNLDLVGFEDRDENGEETGLKYPYIVSILEKTGEILSIRRNYDPNDPLMRKKQYFVHYKFLRSRFLWIWFNTYDGWVS